MNLPTDMMAMIMEKPGQPLVLRHVPIPVPAAQQVLVKVIACGVCRTDLHVLDGELDKLHRELRAGSYVPLPVRRCLIP